MNVIAALLGFFVLKPIIKTRLAAPPRPVASGPAYAHGEVQEPRRAAGS
jgi:hypothetical protein